MKLHLQRHFEHYLTKEKGHMKHLPLPAFYGVYFMTVSVLTQGVADVWIKLMSFTPMLPVLPWRIDFLSLTAISVLMGYQTLQGIKRRELDVTRNSVQIGILVEAALVIGDLLFIQHYQDTIPEVAQIRWPFIFFTSLNILILIYVTWRLDLLKDKHGNRQWF